MSQQHLPDHEHREVLEIVKEIEADTPQGVSELACSIAILAGSLRKMDQAYRREQNRILRALNNAADRILMMDHSEAASEVAMVEAVETRSKKLQKAA